MNKLVGLTLISAVVNNIYSGCKDCCCCCNKKSNNNGGSGNNGNDNPDDKPGETPKPNLTIEFEESTDSLDAIVINNKKIHKLTFDEVNNLGIFNSNITPEQYKRIKCHPLSEEEYKNINDSKVGLKNLHKEGEGFMTVTVDKGGQYWFIDIKAEDGSLIDLAKNKDIESLHIIKSSKVVSGDGLFYITSLKNISGLSNFDTTNLNDMYSMFCKTRIEQLDLSSFNTSNVESLLDTFGQCAELKTLILGDNFIVRNRGEFINSNGEKKNYKTKIENVFRGCINLRSVITNNPHDNLLDALNTISTERDLHFTYKTTVDKAPKNGYYRNDYIKAGYK